MLTQQERQEIRDGLPNIGDSSLACRWIRQLLTHAPEVDAELENMRRKALSAATYIDDFVAHVKGPAKSFPAKAGGIEPGVKE